MGRRVRCSSMGKKSNLLHVQSVISNGEQVYSHGVALRTEVPELELNACNTQGATHHCFGLVLVQVRWLQTPVRLTTNCVPLSCHCVICLRWSHVQLRWPPHCVVLRWGSAGELRSVVFPRSEAALACGLRSTAH
jgi:hypothetical protein